MLSHFLWICTVSEDMFQSEYDGNSNHANTKKKREMNDTKEKKE